MALPGPTWATEHWLSQLSKGLGCEQVTSPRLPIKSESESYKNHMEKRFISFISLQRNGAKVPAVPSTARLTGQTASKKAPSAL